MWQPLLANIAVIAIALLAWSAVGDHVVRAGPTRSRLLFGAGMAAGTVAAMALSFEAQPGAFYDIRGPLIALAGFLGGWPAALMAGGAAAVYRISMGGMVFFGVLMIVATMGIGLAARALMRGRKPGLPHLALLGFAVACEALPFLPAMPAPQRAMLVDHFPMLAVLFFGSTLLFGSVLVQEERRRELTRINRLYRSMVDALPDCLNIKDLQGRFLAANPATARLMQAPSAEALVGRSDFDFYPPGLAEAFLADERRIMAEGVHRTIEQRGLMADGSQGWLSTLKNPIFDADGLPIGLVTHNRDITAAKQLQEKLERTQTFLDEALENMNDGLAMFAPDGTLLFCNRRYRELFRVTGHLLVPGARFEDILRASVAMGEVDLPPGLSGEDYVADRLDGLKAAAERAVDTKDGRMLAGRTTVLANGSSLVMMSDVTEQRNFERHLRHQALHDPLTGLPNRASFNLDFPRLLAQARAQGGELIVMLLDLDHFKQVNDSHGHAAGDALLIEVSRRLEAAIRPGDLVARLGGDEFALLAPAGGLNDAAFAARLMRALAQPMQVGETVLMPSATIGYTMAGRDASDAEGLLKNADRALYQAKARRRGSWKLWAPEPEDAALAG